MALKPRLARVVTNSDAYLWHISNTINMLSENYEIFILGSGVSKYRDIYKNVTFIDIAIKRKPSPIVDLYTLMILIYHFLKIKPVIAHSIMPKSWSFIVTGCFYNKNTNKDAHFHRTGMV